MSIESGSYTALLTPYSDGGDKINFTSIAAMIDRNIDHRISGLYVGGSTAKTFLQSYDERVSVLQETAKLVQGRTRLIAQVGDMNSRTSHKLALSRPMPDMMRYRRSLRFISSTIRLNCWTITEPCPASRMCHL